MNAQSTSTLPCNDNDWPTRPTQENQVQFAASGPDKVKIGDNVCPFHNFIGRFQGLIIWILILAGVLSALLGGSMDVLAVVLLNAFIVFFQEFCAEKPQLSLPKMTASCNMRQHEIL